MWATVLSIFNINSHYFKNKPIRKVILLSSYDSWCNYITENLSDLPNITQYRVEVNFDSAIYVQKSGGFPGGAVVENPPANAGDTGSSPGLGRSHMPQSN